MFAKRHYEAVAEVFQRDCPGTNWDPNKRAQWQTLRNEMASMFEADNGQFSLTRFQEACEPGANVRAKTMGAPVRDLIWPKHWRNDGSDREPQWVECDCRLGQSHRE